MAKFSLAFIKMIKREGGYILSNNKYDTGGETFAGISRKWHPSWVGWKKLDRIKAPAKKFYTDPEIVKLVIRFYKAEFWNKVRGSQISDQLMAESIFDFAVNAGVVKAIRLAQIAIGATPDGKVGNQTIAAINKITYDEFVFRYTVSKVARYAEICNRNPAQRPNLLGWINRTLKTAKGIA